MIDRAILANSYILAIDDGKVTEDRNLSTECAIALEGKIPTPYQVAHNDICSLDLWRGLRGYAQLFIGVWLYGWATRAATVI
ncbi:hypothetical protein [Novosphingobium sp. FSW06-99]|uniref:hypothetical protein n=1 Tax=Novosphingobium sp. FSW06-99 TaxID=1739113 RepID=UPI0018D240A0|nr:hypothetical protein [Novosphingobium sp. FSW06-99]